MLTIFKQVIQFESYVILYGTKTPVIRGHTQLEFESYVILYGTKTLNSVVLQDKSFESYVILYGTKTSRYYQYLTEGLRVM